jgi:hypothetical protein
VAGNRWKEYGVYLGKGGVMLQRSAFLMVVLVSLNAASVAASVEVNLFGTEEFRHSPGKPELIHRTFVARSGVGNLQIDSHRVRSASIALNGHILLRPGDFRSDLVELAIPVEVAHENLLDIWLAGEPDARLTIRVTQTVDAEAASIVDSQGGELAVDDPSSSLSGVKLAIPPGALVKPELLSIGVVGDPPPVPEGFSASAFIQLLPEGILFDKPIRLVMPTEARTRFVYRFDPVDLDWEQQETRFRSDESVLEAAINHFSIYTSLCGVTIDCRVFPPGSTVTYRIDAQTNNAPGYSELQVKQAVRNAILKWADVLEGRLNFSETTAPGADMVFFWSSSGVSFKVGLLLDREALAHTDINLLGSSYLVG